jgi:NADPH:quinone reductase-like Zn-dependent oxidoreductase
LNKENEIIEKGGSIPMLSYLRCHKFGNPVDVLTMEHRETSKLNTNEIRVRMLARPINPSDLIPIRGSYAHRISLPFIPGYEGVGVVEEVGKSVSSSWIGKRVLPLRGEGTWQESVVCPADWSIPIPPFISDQDASQLYINPVTAWLICSENLKLTAGQTLVINAGGSAISKVFGQISRILGFRLICITRNQQHHPVLLSAGADQVIDATLQNPREIIMELTHGKGADAAIDCMGGKAGENLLEYVKDEGSLISIGLLSGQSVNFGKLAVERKVMIKLFHLRHWVHQAAVSDWHHTFATLMDYMSSKQLGGMEVAANYAFQDYKEAIVAAESTGRMGKIMLIQ